MVNTFLSTHYVLIEKLDRNEENYSDFIPCLASLHLQLKSLPQHHIEIFV